MKEAGNSGHFFLILPPPSSRFFKLKMTNLSYGTSEISEISQRCVILLLWSALAGVFLGSSAHAANRQIGFRQRWI